MPCSHLGRWLLILTAALPMTALRAQEPFAGNRSLPHPEVIEAYRKLDARYEEALLLEMGPTDSGRPLHLFLLQKDGIAEAPLAELCRDKTVLFINNGIHPGEPCGVDASLAFVEDLLAAGLEDDVLIAILPIYNVGGALNRGRDSRANQLGPEKHGFRGNARHLDLNRDFIKADALNTLSFHALFQTLQPEIFVDTHTSNGADYPYTLTLISTQKDKLNPVLAKHLQEELEPYLYADMERRNWPMVPYVNVFGHSPRAGYAAFLESPRYASGYTALFNTIGFITEAHMLKPFEDRTEATRQFLHSIYSYTAQNSVYLHQLRRKAIAQDKNTARWPLGWELDSARSRKLAFEGYTAGYKESEIGPYKRLYYDRDSTWSDSIPFYPHYYAADTVSVPRYFVVPQAWREVVLRLQYQDITMKPLLHDTTIQVRSFYLTEFTYSDQPYEGHFYLSQCQGEWRLQERAFLAGDYLIPTDQAGRRFLMATLEPTAVDSYLRWGFFNSILQRKEYFSTYVFEETAAELLDQDPELRRAFEEWQANHPQDAQQAYPSLDFIYRHSHYYEPEHLRYPVAKIY